MDGCKEKKTLPPHLKKNNMFVIGMASRDSDAFNDKENLLYWRMEMQTLKTCFY